MSVASNGNIITIRGGEGTVAKISSGTARLCSLQFGCLKRDGDGVEVLYQGGTSDGIVPRYNYLMGPIVGRAKDDKVRINAEDFPMAQHGIFRDLPCTVTHQSPNTVVMRQTYRARTEVPREGKDVISSFPFDYELIGTYYIGPDSALVFTVGLKNCSSASMPFDIGWHPVFSAPKGSKFSIVSGTKALASDVPVESVTAEKGNAIVFDGAGIIHYETGEYGIQIGHNYGNTQVWRPPDENYMGIEPIAAPSLSRNANYDPQQELRLQPGYKELGPGEIKVFTAKVKRE
jgi:galactose mutarotase-like enzyme